MHNVMNVDGINKINDLRRRGKSNVLVAKNEFWKITYHFVKDDLGIGYVQLSATHLLTGSEKPCLIYWTVDKWAEETETQEGSGYIASFINGKLEGFAFIIENS